MENDSLIAKKIYVGAGVDSHLIGWPYKKWIDPMNDYLKKIGMNVG